MNTRLYLAAIDGATFDQIYDDPELREVIFDSMVRLGYVKGLFQRLP